MSYVKLDKNKLMEMAKNTVAWIHQSRADEKEKLIEMKINSSQKSWFRRLFRIAPMTRERAIELLERAERYGEVAGPSSFELVDLKYWKCEITAKQLLNACDKSADGYVMVSVGELEQLSQ